MTTSEFYLLEQNWKTINDLNAILIGNKEQNDSEMNRRTCLEIEELKQQSRRICFQIEPPRTRRIFMLHYVDGLSWSKVADEMGYADDSTPRHLKLKYLRRQGVK